MNTRMGRSIEELQMMRPTERAQLISRGHLDDETQLAILAADLDLTALAANVNLIPEVQEALAAKSAALREVLANNPSLHAELQLLLARDTSYDVRAAVAANAAISEDIQHLLARDGDWMVRMHLASSKALLVELQPVLAADSDFSVREHIAGRHDLLPDLVRALASDAEGCVRQSLAQNRSVELDGSFLVACLDLSDRGRQLVCARLSKEELDPEALNALQWTWTGTLDELVETTKELAPRAP